MTGERTDGDAALVDYEREVDPWKVDQQTHSCTMRGCNGTAEWVTEVFARCNACGAVYDRYDLPTENSGICRVWNMYVCDLVRHLDIAQQEIASRKAGAPS